MNARSSLLLSFPLSRDYEQSLLGRCLIDGICPAIDLSDWQAAPHREIHKAMLSLDNNGRKIDMVGVLDELVANKAEKRAGGAVYLSQLLEIACSRENVEAYEQYIKSSADKRKLIVACANIVYKGKELMSKPINEWTRELQTVLDNAGSISRFHKPPERTADIIRRVVADLERRRTNGNKMYGFPTGLRDLDMMTGGLCPGDLIIIAGRPGMGKTALATQIAINVAKSGASVLFFSLEMSREQINMRMLAQIAGVNIQALRTGTLSNKAFARTIGKAPEIAKLDIVIDDESNLTDLDIRLRSRRYKPNLAIIDYLTLCRSSKREELRHLEVGNISRNLKALAKELRIPVILLSQLNRMSENRTNKRPMCSDLRQSGDIEQDADVILLLYRDEVYNSESKDKGIAEIIVGKQRNGPTGIVKTRFFSESATFANLAK